ncbi:MAG: hypothetical protein LBG58_16295 [Planctomycetaceae bacterium]|nr:hypothetical protein [Planctomycetaceae bacterium]
MPNDQELERRNSMRLQCSVSFTPAIHHHHGVMLRIIKEWTELNMFFGESTDNNSNTI